MNGNTNAQNVLRSPASAIIRYSGTTVTVAGTISVAMYTQNSTSRPGNCSRANAYAASTENVSWPEQNHRGHQRRHHQRAAEPGVGQPGVVGQGRRPRQRQRRARRRTGAPR